MSLLKKKKCAGCQFLIKYTRRDDGGTIKFTLNSQERNMIKTGRFDDYLNPVYGLECERGHWSEGRGTLVENRYNTIWEENRNDCPDYLEVNYQRDLPASKRVLERKREERNRRRSRIFETFLVILGFVLTVLFANEIKALFRELFS